MSSTPREPLGLIAGTGRLPIVVAQGMRAAGRRVCAVGLWGQYDAALPRHCDLFRTVGIAQIGKWIRTLRRAGVREAVMAGGVAKARMHDPRRLLHQVPDWRAAVIWYRRLRHDRRNAALLTAVAEALDRAGITLIDSTTYIPDHLATAGIMGAVAPTEAQRRDVDFGWPILEAIARLDVGQAIAVRDRDVIAVEAVEGTDAMIARAGALCPARGWTLLKTAATGHDRRADVPTVGVATVERLAGTGGRCLALGAGRVILVDRPRVVAAANHAGIALFGLDR